MQDWVCTVVNPWMSGSCLSSGCEVWDRDLPHAENGRLKRQKTEGGEDGYRFREMEEFKLRILKPNSHMGIMLQDRSAALDLWLDQGFRLNPQPVITRTSIMSQKDAQSCHSRTHSSLDQLLLFQGLYTLGGGPDQILALYPPLSTELDSCRPGSCPIEKDGKI